MTIQEIQRRLSARPFEPFRVLTADGKAFDSRHPETIAKVFNGPLMAIVMLSHFSALNELLVTGIVTSIPKKR